MIRRVIAAGTIALLPALATAEENPAIAYRESLMTLYGMNFGPMASMVKGDIPWDAARMAGWGKDLKAVSGLNAMRGFPAGSEGGESKPEIWQNLEDFQKKMEAMQLETAKLGDLAVAGDRAAIAEQVGAAGKTCKSCHDDYKKEED